MSSASTGVEWCQSGAVKLIPIYDETAPVACTIGDDEVADRVELLERMRDDLERLERTEHGLLLHFSSGRPGIEDDVRRFAVDEKRCCAFWGFDVITSPGLLALRWDGPPEAAGVLDRLAAFLLGDEPASALAGLF